MTEVKVASDSRGAAEAELAVARKGVNVIYTREERAGGGLRAQLENRAFWVGLLGWVGLGPVVGCSA